jgi:hypothetical protein
MCVSVLIEVRDLTSPLRQTNFEKATFDLVSSHACEQSEF